MFCPSCGTQNPDGARFCAHCGMTFATGAQAQVPPAQAAPATVPARRPVSPLGVAGVILSALVIAALLILPWLSLGEIPRTFVSELQPYTQMLQDNVSSSASYTDPQTFQSLQSATTALSQLKADYPSYEAGAFASQVATILRASGVTGIPSNVATSIMPIASLLEGLSPVCAAVGIIALVIGVLSLAANVTGLIKRDSAALRRLPLVGFAVTALICLIWIVAIGVANGQISSALASALSPAVSGAIKGNPFAESLTALVNRAVSFSFLALPLGTVAALILSVAGTVVSALNLRKRA